jgi:hypothetical protein
VLTRRWLGHPRSAASVPGKGKGDVPHPSGKSATTMEKGQRCGTPVTGGDSARTGSSRGVSSASLWVLAVAGAWQSVVAQVS